MSFGQAARPSGPRRPLAAGAVCPCGSGRTGELCCGPLLAGTPARTAEELMRSRYTAFVVLDAEYLAATWHPSTRPDDTDPDADVVWTGLEITGSEAGEVGDRRGTVSFVARWRTAGGPGELRETSRFRFAGDRWWYVDGDLG